ncbi:MAG: voltage-gated potassium channel [Planctomycetota bacterium]|jgi:voltage-gated potassium channel
MNNPREREPMTWRTKLHEIVFESDTPAGKAFDVVLIFAILSSLVVVMLESVEKYRVDYGELLFAAEWGFTLLFSLEYLVRLACVDRPARYARSFFGIVDLLAILPTFVSLLIPGAQALLVIRALRILRVFRVLKLGNYVRESDQLVHALMASRRKIQVFVFAVLIMVVIFGSLMYFIEGSEAGFTSIPRGVYWAVVTMTTVGYGDITPQTNLGQAVSAGIMILGYGIIAVPTGIVSAEMAFGVRDSSIPKSESDESALVSGQACPACGASGHGLDAAYCRLCGTAM